MKKCFVCQKQIEENKEVCNTCIGFFKGKYGKYYEEALKTFQDLLKINCSLESIKSNRRYKNE